MAPICKSPVRTAGRYGLGTTDLRNRSEPAQEKPWTKGLWVYDLRTNMHFTLKTNTLKRSGLDEFVDCYNPKNRHHRRTT